LRLILSGILSTGPLLVAFAWWRHRAHYDAIEAGVAIDVNMTASSPIPPTRWGAERRP
jgi:hypothetical protein